METRVITRVNNVDILASSENQYIPIKPICEALGIDPEAQRQKILSHYLLKNHVRLETAKAKDGKMREMTCLPAGYIFGWLITINPLNVPDIEKRKTLETSLIICYEEILKLYNSK